VIDGEPKAMPERAVWIGVQPVVRTLFAKTSFDFQHPEETLIVANDKHLVIAGRDRWNPAHMEAKGRLAMKTGVQQNHRDTEDAEEGPELRPAAPNGGRWRRTLPLCVLCVSVVR
jgi:hypothetical protein